MIMKRVGRMLSLISHQEQGKSQKGPTFFRLAPLLKKTYLSDCQAGASPLGNKLILEPQIMPALMNMK